MPIKQRVVSVQRNMYFVECAHCHKESPPLYDQYSALGGYWELKPLIDDDAEERVLVCDGCAKELFGAKLHGPDVEITL